MTRKGYDVDHLIRVLKAFKARHPHLNVILEPGSAFAWDAGFLVSTVLDIVKNKGVKTAILDVSFTAHMPDTLEMPYRPGVRDASALASRRTGALTTCCRDAAAVPSISADGRPRGLQCM